MTIYGTMWDSASGAYPPGAALCAFYVNGKFAHKPVSFGRGRVWIDVDGSMPGAAYFLDIETGDARPADFPGWLDRRHAGGGGWGGGYCNRATLPAAVAAAGTRPWALWLATLDGSIPDAASLSLPPNVTLVAVQAFPASMLGFNADESVVVDQAWWQARGRAA
jgi:hypothetical protein